MPSHQDRGAVRRRLRLARQRLGAAEREAAAASVARNLARLGLPRPQTRVAVYLPMDGELDPAGATALARARGCDVYVPVITSFSARRMRFVGLIEAQAVRPNRWGIHEPEGVGIGGRWLDLVLVPCVAFDELGGRLGLGAGFYDRHFSFLQGRSAWRRPRLLGLAYDFQRVARLEQAAWDVPLWGVVSDVGVYGHAAALFSGTPAEQRG
jgi:5-formyltetrahydrofolate cyclo-ligase